jgi:hypothetical protein
MRWPVIIETDDGPKTAYAIASKMQANGSTAVQLEDGRIFTRTHGHVLHPIADSAVVMSPSERRQLHAPERCESSRA